MILTGFLNLSPCGPKRNARPPERHVAHQRVHLWHLRGEQRPHGDPHVVVDGPLGDLESRAAEGDRLFLSRAHDLAERRPLVFRERSILRLGALEARLDVHRAAQDIPVAERRLQGNLPWPAGRRRRFGDHESKGPVAPERFGHRRAVGAKSDDLLRLRQTSHEAAQLDLVIDALAVERITDDDAPVLRFLQNRARRGGNFGDDRTRILVAHTQRLFDRQRDPKRFSRAERIEVDMVPPF